MKIPLGNQGYAVAAAEKGTTTNPAIYESGVGSALRQVGNAGLQVAANMRAEDERIRREQEQVDKEKQREDEALARAKAANSMLDHEITVKTTRQQIEESIMDGSINYEEAEKTFNESVEKIEKPSIEYADPIINENLDKGIKRINFVENFGLQSSINKARKADHKTQTDSALDKLGKLAGMPHADVALINDKAAALDTIGKSSYGQAWDKKKQDFVDSNWSNHARQQADFAANDMSTLKLLQHELTDSKGFYADKLDPEKRSGILRGVIGDIARIENKQLHETDKREAKAERVINEMDEQNASGRISTPAQWLAWTNAVKGTPHEQDFNDRVNDENESQELLRRPITEQVAHIQEKRRDLSVNGGNKRKEDNIKRLENTVNSNIKLLKEQPLLYSQNRTGQTIEPLDLMQIGDPESGIIEQLKDRYDTVSALRKSQGAEVDLNLLLPQEAEGMKLLMSKLPNDGKLQILGMLAEVTQDSEAFGSSIKAIGADKGMLRVAGMARFHKLKSSTGRDLAEAILQGETILADKSVIMPTEQAFKVAFEEYIGDAIPDGAPARQEAFAVYKTLYAAMANDNGVRHSLEDKNIADDKLSRQAIELAAGKAIEYNGKKTMLPYGMKEDEFETKLNISLDRASRETGYKLSILEDMPLMQAPGRKDTYFLMNGGKAQADKKGNPILINIDGQVISGQAKTSNVTSSGKGAVKK